MESPTSSALMANRKVMSLESILRSVSIRLLMLEIRSTNNSHLVIGYIRDHCTHFPKEIINFVLLYLFYVWGGEWDTSSNFGRVKISNNNTMLTKSKWLASWSNVFGVKSIIPNSGTHQWTVLLTQSSPHFLLK